MSHLSLQVARRRLLGAVVLLTLANAFTLVPALAQTEAAVPWARHFNTAGRQRMLSQRMVKAYVLMRLGNQNRAARAQLYEAIELFEAQLAELSALSARYPRLAQPLQQVAQAWRRMEGLLGDEAGREAAAVLLDADARLLAACQGVADALHSIAGSPYSRLVDTSGRQRMLSQRLVKAYLLIAWGVEDSRAEETFVSAWNGFEEALDWLHDAPENTPALSQDLERAREQWLWLKSAISLHDRGTYFPDIVDDAGEKILLLMERISGQYERLMHRSAS